MAEQDLGKAYVQIVPSAKGISGSMSKALNPAAATAGASAGTTVSKSMGSRISAVGKNFIKAGAIATAVSVPIVNGIKDALAAYEVQATAETKLTEIYRARMGASKEAAQSTMELASALQKEGVIGDEVTISGAQQLATFAKYPGTVDKLLPAMDNLLAQQKGVNATTDDAVNIGNLMGKVLMGQTGALKRVGISFTDAQEQVLKYGTEEEKAATLAQVINDNVGNMNAELAKTPSGQMAQLSNTMGDIKEEIGAALAPVLADLAVFLQEKVVPAIERLVAFVQKHPIIAKIALAITGLLAVGGPLLIMIGTLMTIIPVVAGAFTTVIAPVMGVIAAIAAAIAIGVLLYKHWDQIKEKAKLAWEAVKSAIVTPIKNAWNWLKTTWQNIKTMVVQKMGDIWRSTVQKFGQVKTAIMTPIRAVRTWLSNTWSAIRERASNAFQRVKDAITKPIDKAKEIIGKIIDKIKGFFNFDFKLPHIKLPHFSVSPKGWKFSDLLKGSIPSLGIDWYAKGGIVNRPSVIGAGDVRGGEGIIPLTPFWNRLDSMQIDYDRLATTLANELANVTVNGDVTLDGKAVGRVVSPAVNKQFYNQSVLDGRRA